MDPYSQTSSYVDLLNSQPCPQQTSYEPLSQSVQLGSSHLPIFGTQQAEGSSLGGDTPPEPRERKEWSPPDDQLLISAWLNTSKDPIVCNEQKLGAFWKRISVYVAANAKATGSIKREPNNCKNRWQKINEIVTKFSGSYAAATRERASVQNESDVIARAYEIYLVVLGFLMIFFFFTIGLSYC
uniref:Glutathione S-transferase T2 n=1 Tax=Noccaea caerulescens TaxID=107243 RepID=A0A1J3I2Z2_NOCCA